MEISSSVLSAAGFALVIAFIFSMFGQGGGSLYSPVLILLGYSVAHSTSTSLVLVFITSVSAGYIFYREKLIDYKTSFIFAPGISIGAFIGGTLSQTMDSYYLMWIFVIFLLFLGARMVFSFWEEKEVVANIPRQLSRPMYALIAVVGLAIGFMAGLLGIGGGLFLVPFMVYIAKFPLKIAAGSSHLIISFSALAGILGHATSHQFDISLVVVTGLAVLLGGNLGARVSMKINTGALKAGLGLIMWAFAAQILFKLVG